MPSHPASSTTTFARKSAPKSAVARASAVLGSIFLVAAPRRANLVGMKTQAPARNDSPRPAGHQAPRTHPSRARGFTLLETALATVILGVGILALVDAQAAFTRMNTYSSSAATGAYLGNELRERMRTLPRHDPVNGLFTTVVNGQSTLVGWGRETGETTIADLNDLDDFDGVTFGSGGTFAGPIDAAGNVINEINRDGTTMTDAHNAPVTLRGWKQTVTVEKVDPRNFSTVRAHNYSVAASGNDPGISVGGFPLRVTIVVTYTAPGSTRADEMARLVFIAPP